jgi:hypothetical protein
MISLRRTPTAMHPLKLNRNRTATLLFKNNLQFLCKLKKLRMNFLKLRREKNKFKWQQSNFSNNSKMVAQKKYVLTATAKRTPIAKRNLKTLKTIERFSSISREYFCKVRTLKA